ncbi:oligopeptide transporter [Pseudomonas aeruginosa]|nr:oligopeptide transporter [Pseudomonas aeruginosa]
MQERIPDELTLPELTLRGLILGALITVVSPPPTSTSV